MATALTNTLYLCSYTPKAGSWFPLEARCPHRAAVSTAAGLGHFHEVHKLVAIAASIVAQAVFGPAKH